MLATQSLPHSSQGADASRDRSADGAPSGSKQRQQQQRLPFPIISLHHARKQTKLHTVGSETQDLSQDPSSGDAGDAAVDSASVILGDGSQDPQPPSVAALSDLDRQYPVSSCSQGMNPYGFARGMDGASESQLPCPSSLPTAGIVLESQDIELDLMDSKQAGRGSRASWSRPLSAIAALGCGLPSMSQVRLFSMLNTGELCSDQHLIKLKFAACRSPSLLVLNFLWPLMDFTLRRRVGWCTLELRTSILTARLQALRGMLHAAPFRLHRLPTLR